MMNRACLLICAATWSCGVDERLHDKSTGQPSASSSQGAGGASSSATIGSGGGGPSLKEAAEQAGRLIGAAVSLGPLRSDPPYAQALAQECDYVTPENATKWGPLEPTEGAWFFDDADALIGAAEANQQEVKAHVFVWHQQLPSWVAQSMPVTELRAALEAHIATTTAHTAGRVRAWDVVNEAIDDATLDLRAGIHETLGLAGLADAFKWARAGDPDALLYYNDYGIEGLGPKSDAVLALVEDLMNLGAPIDGVGMQAHLTTAGYPSEASLRANIQRFAALGLKVNLSELDVRTSGVPGDQTARWAAQGVVYQLVAAVCATEPACESITTWGITDKYSWVDETFGPDDPLPFGESYRKKPAYHGLLQGLLGELPVASASVVVNGDFSQGLAGWTSWGGTLGVVASPSVSGNAVLHSQRTEDWQGPVQSLLGALDAGDTVSASAWVRLGAGSAPVHLTLAVKEGTSATVYQRLESATANASEWVEVSGNAALGWTQSPTQLDLYLEGPPAGVDLYVDDAAVRVLTGP
jgi:GH35 family endo-1,4-beta-xylanase